MSQPDAPASPPVSPEDSLPSGMIFESAEPMDPLTESEDVQQEPGEGRLRPAVVAAVHLRARLDHGPAPVHGHAGGVG